jgi:diguanylate cyclase (GGDEF)-like protein
MAAIAQMSGLLWIAAGALGIPVVLFDRTHGTSHLLAFMCAGIGLSFGLGLYLVARFFGRWLRIWVLHVYLVTGTLGISAGVVSGHGGGPSVADLSLYIWVVMIAFVAFPLRWAILHLAYVMTVCAVVIDIWIHQNPASVAIMVLGTQVAAGFVVGHLSSLLRRQSVTDPLTGLVNRQAFLTILDKELARTARNGGPLCLAIVDLDYFKNVNDTQGHQAGDLVLEQLAPVWQAQLRSIDTLARYGGDEFVAIMPTCTLDDGQKVIQRLQTSSGHRCSAGIAASRAGDTSESLLNRADEALYRAKELGRNRVVCEVYEQREPESPSPAWSSRA